MTIKFDKFEEQIFLNTVRIENLSDNTVGTGFLLFKKLNEEKSKQILFTNKHVFWGKNFRTEKQATKNVRFTMHRTDNNGEPQLGLIHTFTMDLKRGQAGYFEHPDDDVDVACVNISKAYNFPDIPIGMRSLDPDEFMNFSYEKIHCGQSVFFVGYPKNFYDRKHCLPIMRAGIISSMPDVDFDGKKQILIDAQVFPGSSGSPVFVIIEGKYKLLGIISDAVRTGLDFVEINNAQDGEEPKVAQTLFPVQFIGLGMLFKHETIKEVYNLA